MGRTYAMNGREAGMMVMTRTEEDDMRCGFMEYGRLWYGCNDDEEHQQEDAQEEEQHVKKSTRRRVNRRWETSKRERQWAR